MADRRTRGMTGSDQSRTTAARATAIAEQLHHECSILLELYKKKETFSPDVAVADGRLVSVPPPSSQLDTRDKLWRLHSALLQCRSLLERAIAKEEEELGGHKKGEYETQRKMVKERLSLLLFNTEELLKAVDGQAVLTPSLDGLEIDSSTVFELKLWVYRIFKEVDYWTKMTITTLQALPSVIAKDRARTSRVRSTRSARR
ncbi:ciliary neurotrophic factor [Scomber japonicus]|uniref:ciliary neurotrophic factor n=1 Tax=Scomber japonicus TaxID=13676 RepID=UPI002305BF1A|nr:ciliary neurotrophic factor [Scomber japonicus]